MNHYYIKKESFNELRLEELLKRLSAPGRPGDSLSDSEFAELVDYVYLLIKENKKNKRLLKKKDSEIKALKMAYKLSEQIKK